MPLKFKVDKVEDVSEAHRPLYSKGQDGAFYLEVEGVVAKEKLDEFRTNNIELANKLKNFEGLDPVKYRELVDLQAKGELSGKSQKDIDKLINDRVTTMKTEYENQLAQLKNDNLTKESQLSILLVDNVVRDAATKAGVTGSAIDDILLRAKAVFKLVNGVPTPHDSRGSVVYGKDGTNPMLVTDWVLGLKKDAPHLFPGSSGGGAPGSRNSGVDGSKLSAADKIRRGLEERAGS
jgi:hypothetical protein